MKNLVLLAAAALEVSLFAGVPQVSNVTIASRHRKVYVNYDLAGGDAVVTVDFQTNGVSVGGAAIVSSVTGAFQRVTCDGKRKEILWRQFETMPDVCGTGLKAVVKAWAPENPPDYLVVDISNVPASASDTPTASEVRYYPSVAFLPGGDVLDTRYRTTHLLLKKVLAKGKPFTMGETSGGTGDFSTPSCWSVTMTNNYYLGVFELTQKQGFCLCGRTSTFTKDGDMRPFEKQGFTHFRDAANWGGDPHGSYPDAPYINTGTPGYSSLLGCLNLRVAPLVFDLPSEAQWEFAAQAGQPSGRLGNGMSRFPEYYSDPTGVVSPAMNASCRHSGNGMANGKPELSNDPEFPNYGTDMGTAVCGTYPPNAYGFYDMEGNVSEWCLDYYVKADALGYYEGLEYGRPNADHADIPSSPGVTQTGRIVKGGDWRTAAASISPNVRSKDYGQQYGYSIFGFRLCLTLP